MYSNGDCGHLVCASSRNHAKICSNQALVRGVLVWHRTGIGKLRVLVYRRTASKNGMGLHGLDGLVLGRFRGL
jgi:hypothetical protein